MRRLDEWLAAAARVAVACAFAVAVFAGAGRAQAYPWMIRHAYTGCAVCHADPSGGGVLTGYGRAQGDLLLRTRYGKASEGEAYKPAKTAGFLFGAVDPPKWLLLGGSVRTLALRNIVKGAPATNRVILMESDVRAFLEAGFVRAGASLGYLHEGGRAAQITSRPEDNLVGRHYWIGAAFDHDKWLVRAGRIALPFGIRNIEHTMWIRSSPRTDLNDAQQHGASIAYNGEKLRGELMGIAGNFQVRPDDYRERGWVGFLEFALGARWAAGVSTLGTWAKRDRFLLVETHRQAHGVMVRGAPIEKLVLLAEGILLLRRAGEGDLDKGWTSMLQADFEPIQGVHLLATGEALHEARAQARTSLGGWLSAWWFFLPHVDARADVIVRNLPTPVGDIRVTSLLFQLHAFL
ncbi:MAG: hypothetical protein HYV09_29360 [Deltaproteobacteria bacterium]|nr:hypothetical protein [Deltaproteobacteria bacterium]